MFNSNYVSLGQAKLVNKWHTFNLVINFCTPNAYKTILIMVKDVGLTQHSVKRLIKKVILQKHLKQG